MSKGDLITYSQWAMFIAIAGIFWNLMTLSFFRVLFFIAVFVIAFGINYLAKNGTVTFKE
jgi:hypothetical protein